MRLKGKLVVITGGASGIGRSGCLLFAKEGARVLAIDHNQSALDELKAESQSQGLSIDVLRMDLANPKNCSAAIRDCLTALGRIDVFWGNAGVVGPAGIESLDHHEYSSTINLNLSANVFMADPVITQMKSQGGGSILFTSSISGIVGSRKSPVYAITKHALVGLVRSLAIAHARDGIRVNAICPGLTVTSMLPYAMGRGLDEAAMKKNMEDHISSIPMGRAASAIEIAKAALWLASEDSSYVTGVALPVDGGYTCV